jgi:hemoglobin
MPVPISRAKRQPTEAEIRRMVEVFYARVREDEILAPVFERRIGDAWGPHLDRMTDFWSSLLLASRRYHGNPLEAHRAIGGLEPAHFERWLALWYETLAEQYEEDLVIDIHSRAQRMATVLMRNCVGVPAS